MRTIGVGNAAQPTSGFGPDAITAVKIEVANASDVLVDLSAYAVSLEYDSSADEIVDAATVVFRRLEGVNSLAPLMTASPPVDLGRRIVVSINPGSGTHKEVFRGKITDVDWPERFGDVTVQCLDQARDASRTWIETAREYGSTTGVSLETVMQQVADDNMDSPPTLYFPVATSAVVQHVEGDPPYGPTEQSVLDAERALAESYGGTIRWRHFDASASDWKWTVFTPERSKTTPDHTFGTSDYFDVKQIKLSDADIRNVIEVEYIGAGGAKESITVSDATSIAQYGRLYAKISEGSDSPVNNATLATALANAALSDLKEPDVLLEIACRYFWPGEIGVDLYRFTANNKHFSSDQDLAPMQFRHRIAVGESPTTHIAVRGKPSGGVLSWRRRVVTPGAASATSTVPAFAISNFRETARTATTVTVGWDVAGSSLAEQWLWLSTPAQPIASDPYAAFVGAPTVRLTAATTSYEVTVPRQGLVTYGRLMPIQADGKPGSAWDFTVQPGTAERLIQRAKITATSATSVEITVAVANPTTGSDVTISYTSVGGGAITPVSPQTILAASVTDNIDTTGTVVFTATRPSGGVGGIPGAVIFTASSTDRLPDVDTVTITAQDFPTTALVGTIATAQIADAAITSAKIGAAAVETAKLANLAVTDAILAASAVTETKIATDAVTTPKIIAAAITTAKIAASAVTANEIAANTITAAKIAAGTITATEIAASTITGGKIAANTIVAGNIAAGTITTAEIAANTIVAGDIAAGTITATEIAASTITGAKIAANTIAAGNIVAGTITATELASDSVTTAKILAANITTAKIAAGAVTATEIGAAAVTTAKLDALAVTTDKLAANAVTAAKITAGTITAAEIASNAITTDKINASAVTAAKISVSTLSAIAADVGTLTAGHIRNSGDTAAIRLSGTTALPTDYIDFTATGTGIFLKAGGLSITKAGEVTVSAVKISGAGTAPTVASNLSGTQEGTGATIAISGKDAAGTVTLTTGTGSLSPLGANTTIFTITFGTAYSAAPHGVMVPANGAATTFGNGTAEVNFYLTPTTTTLAVSIGNKAQPGLDASTAYKWSYVVIG